MRRALRRAAVAAVLLLGCGPSDHEQFVSVEAGVERARAARPERPADIRAAADALAALQLTHEKAKAARDACAAAHYHRAEFHELFILLDTETKTKKVMENPILTAQRYDKLDELQRTLPEALDLCSQRILEMPQTR